MGDPFWYDSRVNTLALDSDIVLIMGGTNDANNNVSLGSTDISNHDTSTFYGAYHVLLSKIFYKFYKLNSGYYSDIDYSGVTQVETAKDIQIFLVTPPYILKNETSYNKITPYANAVVDIGKQLGCTVCDLRESGGANIFLAEKLKKNDDYIHLNNDAHAKWADIIANKMLAAEPIIGV